jgi:hypothetical protein
MSKSNISNGNDGCQTKINQYKEQIMKFVLRRKLVTYGDLRNEVASNQGVSTISMQELRQVHGAKRTGIHVNSAISRELAAHGLSHQPKRLPNRQERFVRVFEQVGPIASVISAVLTVKPQNDAVIREAAGADTGSS